MDCSTPGLPVHHQLPAYSHSCPLSWWCHPTISSSVIPISSCLQSCPASESFPMSQFFASDDQSIGEAALASVLSMNTQDWLVWSPCSPRDSQESSCQCKWCRFDTWVGKIHKGWVCVYKDRQRPGFSDLHWPPKRGQTNVHWVGSAIQPSHPLTSPSSSCLQSFLALGSFPMSEFLASDGQSIGVSASVSVFLMNIQDWFPLWWTGWISLQSKGLSRVFSNATVQKHQFFYAQLSL